MVTEFHNNLSNFIKSKDLMGANNLIMRELGKSLVHNKSEFVDLLNYSGIPADASMSDLTLVNKYMDNIHANEKLLIGSAFLVNKNNKVAGFDGKSEVSDQAVKRSVHVLHNYFDGTMIAKADPNEKFYSSASLDKNHSNIAGLGTAITSLLGKGAELGGGIVAGKNKEKFGAMDMATKKQEAKHQMVQQVLAQRQAESEAKKKEIEAKGKKTKIALIIGGSLLGLIIIGTIIYFVKTKKK